MVRRRNFKGASIFTSSDDGESTGSSGDESADVTLPNGRRKGPGRCAGKSWCVLESELQTTVTLPLENPSRRAVKTKADKREVEPKHRIIDRRGDDGRGEILIDCNRRRRARRPDLIAIAGAVDVSAAGAARA